MDGTVPLHFAPATPVAQSTPNRPSGPNTHTLPVGTMVESYRIDAVLGSGGFGITYRVWDTNLNCAWALKEYYPSHVATRTATGTVGTTDDALYRLGLERFRQEGERTRKCQHPNIVKVLRLFHANNTSYLVMEYLEGETCEAALTEGRLQLDEAAARALLGKLLDALKTVHAHGLVHGDLSPSNVMLTHKTEPVLIDFGAARRTFGQKTKVVPAYSPGYSPIECYSEGQIGPSADLYMLAATLYRMITGTVPKDAMQRALAVIDHKPDPLPALATHPPQGFSAAFLAGLDHALAPTPQQRPQTADDWQTLLQLNPPITAQPTPAITGQKARPLAGAITGMAVALAGLSGPLPALLHWADPALANLAGLASPALALGALSLALLVNLRHLQAWPLLAAFAGLPLLLWMNLEFLALSGLPLAPPWPLSTLPTSGWRWLTGLGGLCVVLFLHDDVARAFSKRGGWLRRRPVLLLAPALIWVATRLIALADQYGLAIPSSMLSRTDHLWLVAMWGGAWLGMWGVWAKAAALAARRGQA